MKPEHDIWYDPTETMSFAEFGGFFSSEIEDEIDRYVDRLTKTVRQWYLVDISHKHLNILFEITCEFVSRLPFQVDIPRFEDEWRTKSFSAKMGLLVPYISFAASMQSSYNANDYTIGDAWQRCWQAQPKYAELEDAARQFEHAVL